MGGRAQAWAIEDAQNPSVLRLHVDEALTEATIVTCPPAAAPAALAPLLQIAGVRSLDLHRYRVRINLVPSGERVAVGTEVAEHLRRTWGEPVPLRPEEGPRAFALERTGPRTVGFQRDVHRP